MFAKLKLPVSRTLGQHLFLAFGLCSLLLGCQDEDTFPPPHITLYGPEPAGGSPGTLINAVGVNLSADLQENIVTVNGEPAVVLAVSEPQLDPAVGILRRLTFRIPNEATFSEADLVIARSGYQTDTTRLIVSDQPLASIADITPKTGPPGTIVTLHGTNFNPDPDAYLVIYDDFVTKKFFMPTTENGQVINTLVRSYSDSLLIEIPDGFQAGEVRISTESSGLPLGARYELRSPVFTVTY